MRKLVHYLKPYRLLAEISPLMMMGEVVSDLLLPYLMSFIVNYGIIGISATDLANGSATAESVMRLFHRAGYSRMELIVTFGLLMLAVTLVGGFFGVATAYTSSKAAQSFGDDLRRDAFRKVMSLSIQQTDQFTTGSLITRVTNDISMVVEFVSQLLRVFIRPPIFIFGGLLILLMMNVEFGLILACALPVLGTVLYLTLKKAIPIYGAVQQRLDQVNSTVQESIGGARVIKAYVREDYVCEKFENDNTGLCGVNYRVLKLMAVASPMLSIMLNASVIAVIYIGGLNISIAKAGITTGSIMAAITYMTQSIQSIMMATNLLQSVSRADASARRINEVLAVEPVIHSGVENAQPQEVAVSFRDVSFRYPAEAGRPVLQNINLEIYKGETLAIIGATGSGKSTLMKLLPRFYDATEGEILLDGLPIRRYNLAALRQKLGFVLQKTELVSDTIAGNLRWGKPDATDEELRQAAALAQADDFITGFEDGFGTFVAEKGASLSGGQKQRLSIARALVRKPEILILDDATSALDLATEAALRGALRTSLQGGTVVMIAQRIASVMDADRIAVLENDGSIRHCAPHRELLQISETYRDIYESQMKSGALAVEGGL